MVPQYIHGNVRAPCPGCDGVVTTFERQVGNRVLGAVVRDGDHTYQGKPFARWTYVLLKCNTCGRGGLATIHDNGDVPAGIMEEFYPRVHE